MEETNDTSYEGTTMDNIVAMRSKLERSTKTWVNSMRESLPHPSRIRQSFESDNKSVELDEQGTTAPNDSDLDPIERQALREWIRIHVTSNSWWPIGWAMFLLLFQDASGLYSAAENIRSISLFETEVYNLIFFVSILIFFDLGGELLFVFAHDIPLCKYDFFKTKPHLNAHGLLELDLDSDGKKQIQPKFLHLARLGLFFQLVTMAIWISLIVLLGKDLFSSINCDEDLLSCSSFSSALSAVLVLVIVFMKNLITIYFYLTKFGIYPIVFSEDVLFLHQILEKRLEDILTSFEEWFDPDNPVFEIMETPKFQIILNFIIVLVLDVSLITSVTKLIEDEDSYVATFFRAIPFLCLIVTQTGAYVIILTQHDQPLILLKKEHINRHLFSLARAVRFICLLCWVFIWFYMIVLVINVDCYDSCDCIIANDTMSCFDSNDCSNQTDSYCDSGFCSYNLVAACDIGNDTITYDVSNITVDINNCTTESESSCISSNVQAVNVVLLALVLLQLVFTTFGTLFKAYIYPITVPPYVMFMSYWKAGDKKAIVRGVLTYLFGYKSWAWAKDNDFETMYSVFND